MFVELNLSGSALTQWQFNGLTPTNRTALFISRTWNSVAVTFPDTLVITECPDRLKSAKLLVFITMLFDSLFICSNETDFYGCEQTLYGPAVRYHGKWELNPMLQLLNGAEWRRCVDSRKDDSYWIRHVEWHLRGSTAKHINRRRLGIQSNCWRGLLISQRGCR